jgi:ABC-type branched-subunit amino acid transport system ATPase component
MELVIDNVGVRFGGLWANKGISFAVGGGSIAAVIGPNGAGKSTLFNVISGFIRPTEGEVRLDGERLTQHAPETIARKGLARTFQIPEICHELSVFDNVLVGAHRHVHGGLFRQVLGIGATASSMREARERAGRELAGAGLWELRDAPAHVLPLGKVRLLEIARALASSPRLLLLDEAASGLNSQEAVDLARLVRSLPQRGVTVVLIEHNVRFVMELAQTIAVLDYGELISIGAPDAVRRDERVIAAYLGKRKK